MALRQGQSGQAVRTMQQQLNRLRSSLPPLVEDGNYGPKTAARVYEFQQQRGIAYPTGEADDSTLYYLQQAVAGGGSAPSWTSLITGASNAGSNATTTGGNQKPAASGEPEKDFWEKWFGLKNLSPTDKTMLTVAGVAVIVMLFTPKD